MNSYCVWLNKFVGILYTTTHRTNTLFDLMALLMASNRAQDMSSIVIKFSEMQSVENSLQQRITYFCPEQWILDIIVIQMIYIITSQKCCQ